MAVRLCSPLPYKFNSPIKPTRSHNLIIHSRIHDPKLTHKLVIDVKEKLQKYHYNLPLGQSGRDDEDLILWFLKDRDYSVDDTVTKLAKAISWRQEFGVSNLSEESVRTIAETGKSYVHDFFDVHERPVLMVVASKHLPAEQNASENEKLCVFLVEKALSRLPAGKDEILGIFDLRGFGTQNADLKFITFLFDVFYNYYPRRLGEVLFVDAPFVFKPIWQLAKPLLKSYASLWRMSKESILPNLLSRLYSDTEDVLYDHDHIKMHFICRKYRIKYGFDRSHRAKF